MNLNELLQGVHCSCGRHHTCGIRYVYVEDGAIWRLRELAKDYSDICLVADENTYRAAGRETEEALSGKRIVRKIFSGKSVLIPDEQAIDAVREVLKDTQLIIGIGSGVIQDLCKYVSFTSGRPYFIVATAPSMDGYASTGAAMITGGMKVTYSAKVPEAIIADTAVLKNAPIKMIQAGYGDIIGKYSALNDWKLSRTVLGEYFCDYVYDLTNSMLKKTVPLARALLSRDPESIRILTEALIVVGIAMSFAGNSRPASGSEHHLSHFFEITGIVSGEQYLPHGIDVLYSAVITEGLREQLLSAPFPREGFVQPRSVRERELSRVYGSVAEGCIALQDKLGSYDRELLPIYLEKENELRSVLAEAPKSEVLLALVTEIGLSMDEFYTVYKKEKILDAIRYAKDLKDRYTVLWMYYELSKGRMDQNEKNQTDCHGS